MSRNQISVREAPGTSSNVVSETIMMDPSVHKFHIDSYSGTADLTIHEEEGFLVKWGWRRDISWTPARLAKNQSLDEMSLRVISTFWSMKFRNTSIISGG